MFESLFESRDKKVSNLIKLGDCLGRSLRENVELFSIDDEKTEVTYITENGKVICGTFSIGEDIVLKNIDIETTETFENNKKFDSYINSQISDFISNIHENSFTDASNSFSDILKSWTTRLNFTQTQNKLQEKIQKFGPQNRIIEEPAFQKIKEVLPNLVVFLSENKEKISKIPEIINASQLSNTVSKAFDFPVITYDSLIEGGSYTLKGGISNSIYEMICKQELIKKELLESKKYFDMSWAANKKIKDLAGNIYADEDVLIESLVEAITDIPYLALVSKKQLTTTFTNALSLNESVSIPKDDIQRFSSRIFELKKEVKLEILTVLNEKYGINIQNLKEPPSFKSLLNTQIVIFESLAKLSPTNSVQKETLSNIATMLKEKSGAESIDVNDILQQIFEEAGYNELLEEYDLDNYFSFSPSRERLEELQGAVNLAKKKTKTKIKKKLDGEENDDVDSPAVEGKDEEVDQESSDDNEEDTPSEVEDESEESSKDLKLSKEGFIKYMKEMEDLLSDLSSDSNEEEQNNQ